MVAVLVAGGGAGCGRDDAGRGWGWGYFKRIYPCLYQTHITLLVSNLGPRHRPVLPPTDLKGN